MNFQLWITDDKDVFHKYVFDSVKDAYLFYLNTYATSDDFKYYSDCCGKSLYDIADNNNLIASAFRNVFGLKHFLYAVTTDDLGNVTHKEVDKTS